MPTDIQADLLQYISKNKIIPEFLAKLKPENPDVKKLKKVIEEGDFSSEIWNDKNCNLYLIYLIQEKAVPYWQGITAYVYLMAKMQYTSTQNLRPEDNDTKRESTVEIELLATEGKLTEIGREYLEDVCNEMKKIEFDLDFTELEAEILKLLPIEQWLISIELTNTTHEVDKLIYILLANIPFLQITSKPTKGHNQSTIYYLIPSLALINFIFHKMDPTPMKILPKFGRVGLDEVHKCHDAGLHISALYAPQVKFNLTSVHERPSGAIGAWLHDVGHTFWSNMLSSAERHVTLQSYIPALKFLQTKTLKAENHKASAILSEAIEQAYDFDLTDIKTFSNQKVRFHKYLSRTFRKGTIYPKDSTKALEFEPIGRHPGDSLYFLLHEYSNSNDTCISKNYKNIYKIIIKFIKTGSDFRSQKVVDALKRAAYNAINNPDKLIEGDDQDIFYSKCNAYTGKPPINWITWLTVLQSSKNSNEIWESITSDNERADELTHMIANGLVFFHPFLPLTKAKIEKFIDLINNFIDKNLDQEGNKASSLQTTSNRNAFFQEEKHLFELTPTSLHRYTH